MLSKQNRTKLELVRIEGICKMILEVTSEDALKNKVERVTGIGDIGDVKAALFRLPRYQLIKIIEITPAITSIQINSAYEQYRYGLKPGFTLFSINGTCKKISISAIEDELGKLLAEIPYGEEDTYKQIQYKGKVKIEEDIFEFCFTYLSKYNYISETEEPKFIYELEECFVWISTTDSFIAVQNSPNRITNILKRIFSDLYKTRINNIKLTKKLINDLFGEDKMCRGTFYKPTAGLDEAQKVTVADPNLAEKATVRDTLQGYDITSSHLHEEIDENTSSTLGINCNQGRIYVTRNLSASVFRSWSVKRIKDIIAYLKIIDNSKDFDIFKAKSVLSDAIWTSFGIKQKDMLENIIFAVFLNKTYKVESQQLNCDSETLLSNLFDWFYNKISFECELCKETCIGFCPKCGDGKLIIAKNKTLICNRCGEAQKGSYSVQCESGHINNFSDISEVAILYPTGNLLSKISETLRNYYNIEFDPTNESFYIREGTINFLKNTTGEYISPEDIPELDVVTGRSLSDEQYDKLIKEFENIREKCSKTNNKNCNVCKIAKKNKCIIRLFGVFDEFRPSPHHGQEFGDISIEVTHRGNKSELVGIAKSRIKKSDTFTLSDGPARELIQQFVSMTRDKRVGIISVVCPMRFHEQLVQELKYITRLTGARMTKFDDVFMVKLLDYYNEKNA